LVRSTLQCTALLVPAPALSQARSQYRAAVLGAQQAPLLLRVPPWEFLRSISLRHPLARACPVRRLGPAPQFRARLCLFPRLLASLSLLQRVGLPSTHHLQCIHRPPRRALLVQAVRYPFSQVQARLLLWSIPETCRPLALRARRHRHQRSAPPQQPKPLLRLRSSVRQSTPALLRSPAHKATILCTSMPPETLTRSTATWIPSLHLIPPV
jgi:hypothetical protein